MSRLEKMGAEFRKKAENKNPYNKNNEFGASHPNAVSDGDDKGKGENGGQIGSKTDIAQRSQAATKNKYNKNKEYNDSNA